MRKWKIATISLMLILTAFTLVLFFSPPIRSQIQEISGIAVIQDLTRWNPLKDAATGDNLTDGLLAAGIYGFDGTNFDRATVDPISKALVRISTEHWKVHQGLHFTASDYDNDIDIGSPKYWRITSPNTNTRIHLDLAVSSAAGCLIEFFEGPTITGAGTALTVYNNNRPSAIVATATAFYDTTVSSDGTRLVVIKLGGNFIFSRLGGMVRNEAEWILNQNTSYIIKVTTDANDNQATITMNWYEV